MFYLHEFPLLSGFASDPKFDVLMTLNKCLCNLCRMAMAQVNQKLLYRESDWWYVGLVVQKARKQGKVRFGRILQLTVQNLQMKMPICKCRTVIVVGSYQTSL